MFNNYLNETDLDAIDDDQPIDFSKRYTEQDSYDMGSKKRPLSTPSVQSDIPGTKHPCNDEVKVYCMEGTPFTISTASSLCDLRDVGRSTALRKKSPISSEGDIPKAILESAKRPSNLPTMLSKPSQGITNMIDVTTIRHVSQSSSPLMFSRSSSLESLNSFEQYSVRDDRSSVSAFSTLASGIISPSEIPDSPGELMSPFFQKSKPTKFQFPLSSSEKPKCDTTASKTADVLPCDNGYEFLPDDDMKVYNEEGDFSSMSSFSSLSIRTSSNYDEKSPHKQSNAVVVKVKSSIKITTAVNESNNYSKCLNENKNQVLTDIYDCYSKVSDCGAIDLSISSSNVIKSKQGSQESLKETLSDEILDLKEKKKANPTEIKLNLVKLKESSTLYDQNAIQDPPSQCSDDDSSDEDDILIRKCIQMGMPQKVMEKNNRLSPIHDTEPNIKLQKSMSEVSHATKSEENNTSSFDNKQDMVCKNDQSDSDDDDLIKKCIQLGMPTLKYTSDPQTVNGMKQSNPMNCYKVPTDKNHVLSKPNYFIKLNKQSEKNGMPLQHRVPVIQPNVFRNNTNFLLRTPPFPITNQSIGQRDNCPDGISDEDDDDDDDDDLLAQCIEAGKPTAMSSFHRTERQYISVDRNQNPILQNLRKSPSSLEKSEYKKKNSHNDFNSKARCASPSKDSLCVYRTEDTPILSPTASISDLSALSFNDDKNCLNNSRNSDCSSDSEDDDLLQQCIRSGMPNAKNSAV